MNRSIKLLFSVLILAVILVLISLLQARADDQFDPCAETKKEKAFLKSGTGRPTWYITCWPMRFHVVYDLEETYARYGSWPDDKVHIVFEGKYQGALKVNYDPNSKKEKKITSIWFMAPEPADNPNRTARIIKVDGTIVYGSYPRREDYKIYYLKNPSELVIDCSAWRPVISGGGKWGKWDKEEERFLFKSAYILIKDNLLPPNNSFWNGLIIKSEGGIFHFEILGNKEAFSEKSLKQD